jgi:hypothetical protein
MHCSKIEFYLFLKYEIIFIFLDFQFEINGRKPGKHGGRTGIITFIRNGSTVQTVQIFREIYIFFFFL